MSDATKRHIMGAMQAMTAPPAQDEDERFQINLEKAVDASLLLFYSDKTHDKWNELLDSNDRPGSLALVSALLVETVDHRSGDNMPEDVILPAAIAVLEDVAEYFGKRDDQPFTQNELAKAVGLMMHKLAQDYGTTEEQMREALAEVDQDELQQAAEHFHSLLGGDNSQEEQAEPVDNQAEEEQEQAAPGLLGLAGGVQ